jgi:hypothetical protein
VFTFVIATVGTLVTAVVVVAEGATVGVALFTVVAVTIATVGSGRVAVAACWTAPVVVGSMVRLWLIWVCSCAGDIIVEVGPALGCVPPVIALQATSGNKMSRLIQGRIFFITSSLKHLR